MKKYEITTDDGICPTCEFRPAQGNGPWPGVLFLMDGLAIRPVLFDMAQRLADAGYCVLLPDLFYRAGPYEPFDVQKIFTDEATRNLLMTKFFSSTSPGKASADAKFFLEHMQTSPDVKAGPYGVHGYCMGGGMAIVAAATYPDRFAACASFHGGRLATDAPDSPHRHVGTLKAHLYVASAVEDQSFPPEQEAALKAALDQAHVDYRMETYEGAKHGWTMSDAPMYDKAAAERAWDELLKLYAAALK